MFNAWKARRQLATAKLAGWRAQGQGRLARVKGQEAKWKLAWNHQERRLRKLAHKAGAQTRRNWAKARARG